jgi:hypothetical protein
LLLRNPVRRVILAAHPLARGREFINVVISAPKEQRISRWCSSSFFDATERFASTLI